MGVGESAKLRTEHLFKIFKTVSREGRFKGKNVRAANNFWFGLLPKDQIIFDAANSKMSVNKDLC